MKERKWFRKNDLIIITLLLAVSAVIFGVYSIISGSMDNVQAEILVDGKVVKTISLDEDKVFSLPEKSNILFEIKDGAIRFSQSDCPDKICVNTGFINKAMQTAVCLPNGISVRIVGSDEYGVDTVVG